MNEFSDVSRSGFRQVRGWIVYISHHTSRDENSIPYQHYNLLFKLLSKSNSNTSINTRKNHSPCVGKTKGTPEKMRMATLSHLYVEKIHATSLESNLTIFRWNTRKLKWRRSWGSGTSWQREISPFMLSLGTSIKSPLNRLYDWQLQCWILSRLLWFIHHQSYVTCLDLRVNNSFHDW